MVLSMMLGKRNRPDGNSPSDAGSSSSSSSSNPPGPRVVHEKAPSVISTDEEHFKAVVQSLTGCLNTRHAAAVNLPPDLFQQVAAAVEEQDGEYSPTNSSTTELSAPAPPSSPEALSNARRHRFLPPSAAVRDASVDGAVSSSSNS